MAIIKCKMCGGDLLLEADSTVAECEYCGSRQTVPKADDDKKLTLFARANRLRAACEFDKASGIYETIVADFPEEAEAYWGLVLCKYGIEYVDDPASDRKIPTCHRSSFDSIMEDSDFEQALENADGIARRVYREEAKAIEEIRKGIIAVSANEQPYDIFICYKETGENGERTLDSVLAQDIYDALTAKGYRVFFSRITLEDKLGVEYEPYIFAALNSAKIMLSFGTDYEYFNAVWVKNEWSRYLKLMAKDKQKHLIPCYKGIDAYDMPKEFAKLQAQDLGKVGATQDLLRGIEKLLPRQVEAIKETVVMQQATGTNTSALLERGNMALEDGEWQKADDFFEEVLNQDPHCTAAYLGKFLLEEQVSSLNALAAKHLNATREVSGEQITNTAHELTDSIVAKAYEKYGDPYYFPKHIIQKMCNEYTDSFISETSARQAHLQAEQDWWENNKTMAKVMKFSDPAQQQPLLETKARILSELEARLQKSVAADQENSAKAVQRLYQTLEEYDQKYNQMRKRDYQSVCGYSKNASSVHLESAIRILRNLGNYKDSKQLLQEYQARLDAINQASQRRRQLNVEKANLESELSRLGLFGNRARKQLIETRLKEIVKEIDNL